MKYRTKIRVLGVGGSFYHVMSRITERRFYMGMMEKNRFRQMMRRVAEFSGVDVVTYCVLDNHFHMLIRVPKRVDITTAELLRRLRLLYGNSIVEAFERELCEADEAECNRLRERYLYRMYNLSEFMKTLKQRYAMWFNATHNRSGHLWDDRFKSVLVEGQMDSREQPGALWIMAQYIELNAVRAGIVKDAAAYAWCGYAEAVQGNVVARRGIELILEGQMTWRDRLKLYGVCLRREDRKRVEEYAPSAWELRYGAWLWLLLANRVRYLIDGVIFGRADFVEENFALRRELFCESRKSGARKMRGGDWGHLCTVRDFRKSVEHA